MREVTHDSGDHDFEYSPLELQGGNCADGLRCSGDREIHRRAMGNASAHARVCSSNAPAGGRGQQQPAGAVWFFIRRDGVWSQQGGKLADLGTGPNVSLGQSVALSADGNSAIAGGPGDANGTGAAWLFHRANGAWTIDPA